MKNTQDVLDIGYKLAIIMWFCLEVYCFLTGIN